MMDFANIGDREFVSLAEKHNVNSMRNTATGMWLQEALARIRLFISTEKHYDKVDDFCVELASLLKKMSKLTIYAIQDATPDGPCTRGLIVDMDAWQNIGIEINSVLQKGFELDYFDAEEFKRMVIQGDDDDVEP